MVEQAGGTASRLCIWWIWGDLGVGSSKFSHYFGAVHHGSQGRCVSGHYSMDYYLRKLLFWPEASLLNFGFAEVTVVDGKRVSSISSGAGKHLYPLI